MPQNDTPPQKACNPLRRWLDARGVSVYCAAKTLQKAGYKITIERLRLATLEPDHPKCCPPTWPLMGAIYRMTGGAVTPNDWADPDEFPGLDNVS